MQAVNSANTMSALFLVVVLLGILNKRRSEKSARAFILVCLSTLAGCLADIGCGQAYSPEFPEYIIKSMCFLSYTFGSVSLFCFTFYCYIFVKERTDIKEWVYHVPMTVLFLSTLHIGYSFFAGKVVTVSNGGITVEGGIPFLDTLVQMVVLVYLPSAAFCKRRQIGIRRIFLLGMFGVIPLTATVLTALTDMNDYSYSSSALSVVMVYILLENNLTLEADRKNEQILREKNRELEEKQEQLEDLACEQEAQLEEITALNEQLQGNQAELEEAAAEQEAQLEEITNLNDLLLHNQDKLEKAMRDAEAANLSKTMFLNNMSHDIRTPMNAILGFTDLMDKKKNDPEVISSYIKKIQISGKYLLNIINNILDMARIESGHVVIDDDIMDISSVESSAIPLFEELLRQKDLKLIPTMNVQHPYVFVDVMKTHQITVNLLSNAIKYTPEGGTIIVDMTEIPCQKEGYGTYVMTVSDTGIGMSPEFCGHVFDSFSRERNTTESKVIGTGLGMSIVKKLVDLMGGTITVESELGKGTTFTVTMMHRIAMEPDDYLRKQKVEADDFSRMKGRRILLAEDNELNAEIAVTILEENGFKVERAEDGVQCIKMLTDAEAGYYDIILMDIQMPNLNGFDATMRIRSLSDKSKGNIPILAMTANAFDEDAEACLDAGMNGHVSKPIDLKKLMESIYSLLKDRLQKNEGQN